MSSKSKLENSFVFYTTYYRKLDDAELRNLTREFLRKKGVKDVNDFKVKLYTGKIAHRSETTSVRTIFIDILQ
jgi:hypothetical protein